MKFILVAIDHDCPDSSNESNESHTHNIKIEGDVIVDGEAQKYALVQLNSDLVSEVLLGTLMFRHNALMCAKDNSDVAKRLALYSVVDELMTAIINGPPPLIDRDKASPHARKPL